MKTLTLANGTLGVKFLKKETRLFFLDATEPQNNRVRLVIEAEELPLFIQTLEAGCTQSIKKEDKAYCEEISTYRNEVERALSIGRPFKKERAVELILTVYTDQDYDDNWMLLTPKKLAYLIGLLYGYVNAFQGKSVEFIRCFFFFLHHSPLRCGIF